MSLKYEETPQGWSTLDKFASSMKNSREKLTYEIFRIKIHISNAMPVYMCIADLNRLLLASKIWPDSSLAYTSLNLMQQHFDTISNE